jgi:hypothetical protein
MPKYIINHGQIRVKGKILRVGATVELGELEARKLGKMVTLIAEAPKGTVPIKPEAGKPVPPKTTEEKPLTKEGDK